MRLTMSASRLRRPGPSFRARPRCRRPRLDLSPSSRLLVVLDSVLVR